MSGRRGQTLELADIQGNVVKGYGLARAAYRFVHVENQESGRRLLGDLAERVTTAAQRPESALNVAVTALGLEALGVPADVLETFPPEFRQGMAARAERWLGDAGMSHSDRWERRLGDGWAHLLLMHSASSEATLERDLERWRRRIEELDGLVPGEPQCAALLDRDRAPARDHFGYRDGFAQPLVESAPGTVHRGGGVRTASGWRAIKAGEFVLGYDDEDGGPPPAPVAPLGRNGTFMVYRKLRQDVAAFRAFVTKSAAGSGDAGAELAAAKVVGRWRGGAPLELAPAADDPGLADDRDRIDDFHFSGDPTGERCPLGAHIRRANPRDGLVGEWDRTRRHRIMRRGMPYGPPFEDDPDEERGLIFVCFNASIARQFETVNRWLWDGSALQLGDERDLFASADGRAAGRVTVQGRPPRILETPAPMVVTRGGEYLFVPGMTALRALAAGPDGPSPSGPAGRRSPAARAPVAPLRPERWIARLRGRVELRLGAWMLARPALMRWGARHLPPVLRVPFSRRVFVFRHDDVRAVLAHDDVLAVVYLPMMEALRAPFFLGLDDSPEYRRQKDAAMHAVRRSDLEAIGLRSEKCARALLAEADGEIDVVQGLVDVVIADALAVHLGVGDLSGRGLDAARAVFHFVFIHRFSPAMNRRAEDGARILNRHLDAIIADRRATLGRVAARDDGLGRLLAWDGGLGGPLSDEEVRTVLLGLIVAWVTNVSRATTMALDWLLTRPGPLRCARAAADLQGAVGVGACLAEALRFRPPVPMLERRSVADVTIADRRIRAGHRVMAVGATAMMDEGAVDVPAEFRTGRPAGTYLQFGHGMHECLGRHLASRQGGAIAAALLRCEGLQRAPGQRELSLRQPFPARLQVVFEKPAEPGP